MQTENSIDSPVDGDVPDVLVTAGARAAEGRR
jgi:hypothetical protein